jgi:hypothetical protein
MARKRGVRSVESYHVLTCSTRLVSLAACGIRLSFDAEADATVPLTLILCGQGTTRSLLADSVPPAESGRGDRRRKMGDGNKRDARST